MNAMTRMRHPLRIDSSKPSDRESNCCSSQGIRSAHKISLIVIPAEDFGTVHIHCVENISVNTQSPAFTGPVILFEDWRPYRESNQNYLTERDIKMPLFLRFKADPNDVAIFVAIFEACTGV